MKDIKVSIIIPVYNVEKYLRQCLDSVINQTFEDIEIICINDCSTDNSLNILKEFILKDNRIKIIDLNQNKGVSNARNEGVKFAKGKYLTFIDSDDWVTKDYVEVLYNSIEKYNTDFVVANQLLFNNITSKITIVSDSSKIIYDKLFYEKKDKDMILQNISCVQMSTIWANIFKRSFISENNLSFKEVKLEDVLFMWEVFIKAHSFIFIRNSVYYYRIAIENSNVVSRSVKDKLKFFCYMKKLTQEKFKEYLTYCYTYISLKSAILMEKLPLRESKENFYKVRKLIYDKSYKVDYSYINFRDKIRLFVFSFCLKHNINYYFIAKFHRKFNPIRLVKR